MARTLRSKKLRWLLWEQADGKCRLCGYALDPHNWHADHIVPWSVSRRTNVHEMQALCPACNLRKGSSTVEFYKSAFRDGQLRAYDKLMERFSAKETHTSIVLPTRYGKSDVIRVAALIGQSSGKLCQSLVVSPSADLRHQIVDKVKLKEMAKRYGISLNTVKACHEITKAEINPGCNGEYLLSSTMQFLHCNIDVLEKLIDSRVHASGLPFAVFIDETHLLSDVNKWGGTAERIVNAGGLLALLTATPTRADSNMIPGFKFDELERRDAYKYVPRDHPTDPEKVLVDVYEGDERRILLVPDEWVTFAEAWREDPSPLCDLTRDVIDFRLSEEKYSIINREAWLSELTPAQARQVLGEVCRDEKAITLGARKAVDELRRIRAVDGYEDAGMIVFTGRDRDPDKRINEHAEAVNRAIQQYATETGEELDCKIATSAGDEKPSRLLQNFGRGNGDVIIVKNSGGAGFDCERLKVILDLSPTRTIASTTQRIMRVATPWKHMRVGVVITLADKLMANIWHEMVKTPGGEWVGSEFEFRKTLTNDRRPKPPPSTWFIEAAEVGGYDDSKMNVGNMQYYGEVERVLSAFPELGSRYTKPQIAERLNTSSQPSMEDFETNDDVAETHRRAAIRHVRDVVNARIQDEPSGYTTERYGELMSECWGVVFRAANVPETLRSVSDTSDLSLLRRIDVEARRLWAEQKATEDSYDEPNYD